MGINMLDMLPPVVGKISLGIRKPTSGGDRPANTDYFVLDHIDPMYKPTFVDMYGEKPDALDIVFLSDDFDQVIPTWYCWFSSGIRNERGEMLGGKLKCKGNGPDSNGNPGTAMYIDKRDPITKLVPTRDCFAANCPDWFSPKGVQQCSQTMQVFCLIPLVTMDGVFSISTRSWNSIKSFHRNLNWIKEMNDGKIRHIPLKVYREEESIPYTDHTGASRTSKHAIMKIARNHEFERKHGKTVIARIRESFKYNVLMPKSEIMEIGATPETPEIAPNTVLLTSESLVNDPEVSELFDKLEVASNKAFSNKARLLAIRKLEGAEDLRSAVIDTLATKISEATAKNNSEANSDTVGSPAV